MYVLLFLSVILISSCATTKPPDISPFPTARQIVLPSGDVGYSITCDNENVNYCYMEAGDFCHRGYEIISSNIQTGHESKGGSYSNSYLSFSSERSKSTSEKGMIIKCKNEETTKAERELKVKKWNEKNSKNEIELALAILGVFGVLTVLIIASGVF